MASEEEEASQRNRALTRWAKLREQGYSRYLLLHGVLGHGMPLAGFLILAALFFGIRGRLLVTVGFVGAVGGLGSGMGTWTFYERQYLRESHRRGFDVLPPKE